MNAKRSINGTTFGIDIVIDIRGEKSKRKAKQINKKNKGERQSYH